ncbi:hypothetical protein [Streptomyces antimycoticus]|uniref:hypothetical protein n=1 Tax=Streptomyces antimycoticus TaxID=68175 RepID=UPI000A38D85C|nr:hypothetical protein [Streptomyces antimycoticus]
MRCSLLRPDPAQRDRLVEIRDNLLDRIAEAEQEGWLGEIEGLQVSLDGAQSKISQIDTTGQSRAGDARHANPSVGTTTACVADTDDEEDCGHGEEELEGVTLR